MRSTTRRSKVQSATSAFEAGAKHVRDADDEAKPTPTPKRSFISRVVLLGMALVSGVLMTRWYMSTCGDHVRPMVVRAALFHKFAFAADFGVVRPVENPDVNSTRRHCSPTTIALEDGDYPSSDRFYHAMARMVLTPPPVFFGDDMRLCDPPAKAAQEEYCMPVGGRMDRRYCDAPERMELLVPQTPTQICWASVLHLVLLEVYNELQRAEARPLLMHGTLFGAKSQGSLLPSAKYATLAYVNDDDTPSLTDVAKRLKRKGIHMFQTDDRAWHACLAPTHPLAFNIYPAANRTYYPDSKIQAPYVDLLKATPINDLQWFIEKSKVGHLVPNKKMVPFSNVTINGFEFTTVADPADFLLHNYGNDYVVQHTRTPMETK